MSVAYSVFTILRWLSDDFRVMPEFWLSGFPVLVV